MYILVRMNKIYLIATFASALMLVAGCKLQGRNATSDNSDEMSSEIEQLNDVDIEMIALSDTIENALKDLGEKHSAEKDWANHATVSPLIHDYLERNGNGNSNPTLNDLTQLYEQFFHAYEKMLPGPGGTGGGADTFVYQNAAAVQWFHLIDYFKEAGKKNKSLSDSYLKEYDILKNIYMDIDSLYIDLGNARGNYIYGWFIKDFAIARQTIMEEELGYEAKTPSCETTSNDHQWIITIPTIKQWYQHRENIYNEIKTTNHKLAEHYHAMTLKTYDLFCHLRLWDEIVESRE